MKITAIKHYDQEGRIHFFVVDKFNDDHTVTGKVLSPNDATNSYEFDESITESIDSFEDGFTLAYYGGTSSRTIPFEHSQNLIRMNPQIPRIYQ